MCDPSRKAIDQRQPLSFILLIEAIYVNLNKVERKKWKLFFLCLILIAWCKKNGNQLGVLKDSLSYKNKIYKAIQTEDEELHRLLFLAGLM